MTINPNEKTFTFCPRCGNKNLQPNDAKSFCCSNCSFIFYINTAAATAALIFDSNNHLLATVRKDDPGKGTLDLPGGFSDQDEKIEETLVREVKEELNLDVYDLKYFCSEPNDYRYKEVNYTTLDMFFTCKTDNFDDITAGDDVVDFCFLELSNLNPDNFGLKSIKNVITKLSKINPDKL